MSSRASPGKADAPRMCSWAHLHLQRLEARVSTLCMRCAIFGCPRIRGRGNSGRQKLREGDAEGRGWNSPPFHVGVHDAAPGEARLQMRRI